MINCDNGTNASLSLSLSSENKSCWIVRFFGELVKVGVQVPERRGLVGGGGGDERVLVRHRPLFGGEESDGMVGGSGSSWWH